MLYKLVSKKGWLNALEHKLRSYHHPTSRVSGVNLGGVWSRTLPLNGTPDFYKALPCVHLGAEAMWTKNYSKIALAMNLLWAPKAKDSG